jgi:hypothetical protein
MWIDLLAEPRQNTFKAETFSKADTSIALWLCFHMAAIILASMSLTDQTILPINTRTYTCVWQKHHL